MYYGEDEDGDPFKIPACYTVCPRCHGNGKHVNPSIDGHGISGDDECWDDDDFREMYFGGGYDVTCEECDGVRVVLVVDEDRASAEQLAHYGKHQEAEWEDEAMARMERMYGG
jgi:hypothetical protein